MQANDIVEIVDNTVKSKYQFQLKHSSLVEAVLKTLNKNGSKIAMVDCDSGRHWKAADMFDAILTLGVQLAKLGIAEGHVVAFFCPNSDLHAIAMFAVMSIGGVYTGLLHKNPLREVQSVVNGSGASYLIGCIENKDICNQLLSTTKSVKQMFMIDDRNMDMEVVSISSLLKNKVENSEKKKLFESTSKLQPDQLCKISFSSGTTGHPKAVISTNRNCLAAQTINSPGFDFVTSENDTAACIGHFAHTGASSILFMSLLNESKCVIFSHFESHYFVENVEKYSVTFAFLVPSYLNLMNLEILEPIVSFKLKNILIAGESLSKGIGEEFIQKFKPDYFGQGLGSTEIGWCTVKPTFDGVNNIMTCGVPTFGCQVKVIDLETGQIVGANKHGEIYIKGPQVYPGYLNNNKATQEAFDEHGFFKTGDVGYFDTHGYLFYIERIKETLKYNGAQVSTTELVSILLEHGSVKEAAVIGVPDEVYGQLPKAFVVLKDSYKNNVTENNLLTYVNERVADHKKLRGGLVFMQSLPKTILGKIDKRTLKSL